MDAGKHGSLNHKHGEVPEYANVFSPRNSTEILVILE